MIPRVSLLGFSTVGLFCLMFVFLRYSFIFILLSLYQPSSSELWSPRIPSEPPFKWWSVVLFKIWSFSRKIRFIGGFPHLHNVSMYKYRRLSTPVDTPVGGPYCCSQPSDRLTLLFVCFRPPFRGKERLSERRRSVRMVPSVLPTGHVHGTMYSYALPLGP